jgi:hypothetical protein
LTISTGNHPKAVLDYLQNRPFALTISNFRPFLAVPASGLVDAMLADLQDRQPSPFPT